MDIQQLKSLKVLVIGDHCIDVFKYGECKRLSPEAPVPVFHFRNEIEVNGMAGNVYNNLISLGVQADIIKANNIIRKERCIDIKSKQHLLRIDYESPTEPIKIDKNIIKKYDAIVVSDYCKGSINIDNFSIIKCNFDGPIFVDTKNPNILAYTTTYTNIFVKINEDEYRNAISLPSRDDNLIVTLGSSGARYKDKIYPTKNVEVFDVSGAGDTFLSGLCVQYLLSNNMEQAIKFANICASTVVKKSGTAIVNFEEVKNDLCF